MGAHLQQLPPLLPTRHSSAWGLSHSPSVMPSTVARSSTVQSPNLRKNVPTTCSLAVDRQRQLFRVFECLGCGHLFRITSPPSPWILVHSRDISDALPGPLPPLPPSLGFTEPKVDRFPNRCQDSWTGTKDIPKPSRKLAWAQLAPPILALVISAPYTVP